MVKKSRSAKYLWFLAAVILILVLWFAAIMYSVSKIEVVDVSVEEINDISLSGFNVNGAIQVENNGILPVNINYVDYSIILDQSGEILTEGRIEGVKIKPGQTESIQFSSEVKWIPTAEIALGLIRKGGTHCILSGNVYVNNFVFEDLQISFEESFDIEPYIKQFIGQKVERALETVADTFGRIVDGLVDILT